MKTAISLPDDLFAAADGLSRRLGMTRSGLIAMALTEFVARHRTSKVTERLDAVYAVEENCVEPALSRAQRKVLKRSAW